MWSLRHVLNVLNVPRRVVNGSRARRPRRRRSEQGDKIYEKTSDVLGMAGRGAAGDDRGTAAALIDLPLQQGAEEAA